METFPFVEIEDDLLERGRSIRHIEVVHHDQLLRIYFPADSTTNQEIREAVLVSKIKPSLFPPYLFTENAIESSTPASGRTIGMLYAKFS